MKILLGICKAIVIGKGAISTFIGGFVVVRVVSNQTVNRLVFKHRQVASIAIDQKDAIIVSVDHLIDATRDLFEESFIDAFIDAGTDGMFFIGDGNGVIGFFSREGFVTRGPRRPPISIGGGIGAILSIN